MGLASLEQGIGETLQGSIAPDGMVIESWPGSAFFRIPVRTAGGTLLGLGLLTIVRQLAMVVTALTSHAPVTPQELASWVSDLAVMCPALLVAGAHCGGAKRSDMQPGRGCCFNLAFWPSGLSQG